MKRQQVFVFGSNLGGRHGAGSALHAMKFHGAKYGTGFGPTGNAYAIPTKDANFQKLPLTEISPYVTTFLQYARDNPDFDFNIVAIGTGLAGFTNEQIGPMFKGAPENCNLPAEWEKYR